MKIGGVIAALIAVVALAVILRKVVLFRAAERLRSEAARVSHRTWQRPPFAEERDGVFATLARPGLVQLEWHPVPGNCRELWERGTGTLDAECRQWLAEHWPAAALVLAATHAKLGSWDLRTLEDQADATEGLIRTAQLAAVHMLWDVQQHNDHAATSTCLEALALGREAATMGTVLGTTIAAGVVRAVFPTCETVINTGFDGAAMSKALEAIEDGLPPPSRMFHTEALVQAASLDATAKKGWSPKTSLEMDALLEGISECEADAQVADEPEPDRSADIKRNERRRAWSLNPDVRGGSSVIDFVHREEELHARLRILREAAEIEKVRVETGAWPPVQPPLSLAADQPRSLTATLRDLSPLTGALEVVLHSESGGDAGATSQVDPGQRR